MPSSRSGYRKTNENRKLRIADNLCGYDIAERIEANILCYSAEPLDGLFYNMVMSEHKNCESPNVNDHLESCVTPI